MSIHQARYLVQDPLMITMDFGQGFSFDKQMVGVLTRNLNNNATYITNNPMMIELLHNHFIGQHENFIKALHFIDEFKVKHVSEITELEIRPSNNLCKMIINGAFSTTKVNQTDSNN